MEETKTGPDIVRVRELAKVVLKKANEDSHRRYLLGIVGYPGAGKSTFAAQLVDSINTLHDGSIAKVVPMDGYHFSNEELNKRNLLPLKGIPDTFDAEGFVQLLQELRARPADSVFCPRFDRSMEASIENDIEVKPTDKIIVSEGNYLLLDKHPWNKLPEIFDEIWFINSSLEIIEPRLFERHLAGGRDEQTARAKMNSTDLPNAKLIEETKHRANRIIEV